MPRLLAPTFIDRARNLLVSLTKNVRGFVEKVAEALVSRMEPSPLSANDSDLHAGQHGLPHAFLH